MLELSQSKAQSKAREVHQEELFTSCKILICYLITPYLVRFVGFPKCGQGAVMTFIHFCWLTTREGQTFSRHILHSPANRRHLEHD